MWKQSVLQTAFIATIAALIKPSLSQHHKLPNGGEIKAVLVAGSKGWDNYRHQADVCHAYHILRGNGIPDENIIVMIYDDIAHNEQNPYPGVIYNRPGGPDVYKNCKKDYTGEDVNKEVFFAVLQGNKAAVKGIGSGRVLESGPSDHVFLNFVDHGDLGLLYMPGFKIIHASEIIKVFKEMANNSRFKKMFFYVEACYSGSVAELIPKNLNIFTMTAANDQESSCPCFDSENIHTPLGDEFSVKWMRDAETANLKNETVQQEFEKVHSEVKQSHPMEYGDLQLGKTKVSEVLGYNKQPLAYYPIDCGTCIPQHQVPMEILKRRIAAAKSQEEKAILEKELQEMLQTREEMAQFFSKLAEELLSPDHLDLTHDTKTKKAKLTNTNLACYESAVKHLDGYCFQVSNNPFVGTHLHILINLCNLVPEARLVKKIQSMCQEPTL